MFAVVAAQSALALLLVAPAPNPLGLAARAPRRRADLQCSGAAGDGGWARWAAANGVVAPKLGITVPAPDARGKGGVVATEAIAPMEVIARIPRGLLVSAAADDSDTGCWATALLAATLSARFDPAERTHDDAAIARMEWINGWTDGGWATDNADLGRDGVRHGSMDVTGSLLATGSDNDDEIYRKFRIPCHPVINRAAFGLAALTRADAKEARAALQLRGTAYRAMREQLLDLVPTPTARRTGSLRDKRSWDIADTLSRVLSRATALQLDGGAAAEACAVVPLHERLAHCDARGPNAKLVGRDPTAESADEARSADEPAVLLVATRAIERGEAVTRDYEAAPRLAGDETSGALRLLLQHGLPPSAWPAGWDEAPRPADADADDGKVY